MSVDKSYKIQKRAQKDKKKQEGESPRHEVKGRGSQKVKGESFLKKNENIKGKGRPGRGGEINGHWGKLKLGSRDENVKKKRPGVFTTGPETIRFEKKKEEAQKGRKEREECFFLRKRRGDRKKKRVPER